ncbi:MAG: hypothetical protein U0640_02705 [Phycisphaerales bacterium]
MAKQPNRYERVMEHVFFARFTANSASVEFSREDFVAAAKKLRVDLPKNLGDIIYSFRNRASLPARINATAPTSKMWIIKSIGRSRYQFVPVDVDRFVPTSTLIRTSIPDATPGIVSQYAMSDEQALLAKLRYNRLLDIFTGLTCYSLQSHLRTSVPGTGQIEVDELYVGLDKYGAHTVIPVQAKGGTDSLGLVQVLQDLKMCEHKFPNLLCRAIGAQFLDASTIALFEFTDTMEGPRIVQERHYKLVAPTDISAEELAQYKRLAQSSLR